MTADEAIALAKQAFGARDVTITADGGVVRIESNTHVATSAFMHDGDGMPATFLQDVMLPEAVDAMDRMIASGKAPPRKAA